MAAPPPPPPPPHGANPRSSNLPPGNYDIFVIPPHSSGSGFLYLPSLQPHRNSFLAGVFCTLAVVGVWTLVVPVLREWASSVAASGGAGVILFIIAVGVVGWAVGKTQMEQSTSSKPAPSAGTNPFAGAGTSWQQPPKPSPAAASWEKAREEMRKKEEERRKKEEAEKKAREAAEKDRWDKARQREKEMREKEAREKIVQERLRREKEAKEAEAKASNYKKPTASSYVGDDEAYSYRPYDEPKKPTKTASSSSFVSQSSYAPSHSTARTTPPPSQRGPYTNKDPDKVTIKAVYAFTDLYAKPVAQLVSGKGSVTDGLVLKMTTEGLFIDDDIRGVGQREWDMKAWTLKLIESGDLRGKHVLRASIRDAENKKYVFIIDESEAWKVAVGLQRLRKGTQVRSLGVSGLGVNETNNILKSLGWG